MGYQLWTPGKLTPFFSLFVAGFEISQELRRYVRSINISHRHQEALTAKVVIVDDKLQWSDLDIFDKGAEWVVTLGSRDDFRPFGPFEVAGYQMAFGSDAVCTISLDLMDKMRVLNSCARARSWSGKTVGQMVQQIAEENGLGFVIEDSDKITFDDDFPAVQANWTDARFLRKIADRYGYFFSIQDGNIVFRQDQVNQDVVSPKILAWRTGTKSLMSFEPAQQTFIKKGGGKGSTGQTGDLDQCDVDIPSGSAGGTQEEDDVYGTSDPNDFTMDDVVSMIFGGAEEQSEAGDVLATADASDDDRSSVTEPAPTSMWEGLIGPKSMAAKRKVATAMRDAVGETPVGEKDKEAVTAAAGAGTKSDIAISKAKLTVYDVTVRQGDPVEVVGVGRRFSGRWRVVEFEHNLDTSGLMTELGLGKKGLGPSSTTEAAEDAAHNTPDASDRDQEQEKRWHAAIGPETFAWKDGDGQIAFDKYRSRK